MTDHNRRIRNKERCAFRPKKIRYSVFRAKYNRHWEAFHERMVRHICKDHGLNVEEQMVEDDREPWDATYHHLLARGYRNLSRSIRDIQMDVERENPEGLC